LNTRSVNNNSEGPMSDGVLKYITSLSVSPSQGTLYYQYVSVENHGLGVGTVEKYYYNPTSGNRGISDITFVPNEDFQGVAAISYTGYSVDNNSFSGEIRVTVSASGDVTYTTVPDTPVAFKAEDFSDVCLQKTGLDLDNVTFVQPSASQGVLYYNYRTGSQHAEQVTTGAAYYSSGSPRLDNVTFLPASGCSGTVTIEYRGTNAAGTTYSGTVTITVTGSSGVGSVFYSGTRGQAIPFVAADFTAACQEAIGETLSYVQFELPDSSQGVLYTNYMSGSGTGTPVSGSTQYTRAGTDGNCISDVSFVAAANAADTVNISFTAISTKGSRYDGQVRISLTSSTAGQLAYRCKPGETIALSSADFNSACRDATGASLDYVQFITLPSSDQGTLTYTARGGSTRSVTTGTSCHRAEKSPLIDSLIFTPAAGFSGTVTLRFNGYDIDGMAFTGSVRIEVPGVVVSANGITYNVLSGRTVNFQASDFDLYCQGITGSSLSYVRFTLPVPNYGVLYDSYSLTRSSNTRVQATNSYSPNGGAWQLNNVSFTPAASFTGTTQISYTGHSVSGSEFQGVVTIQVWDADATRLSYTTTSLPATIQAADLRQVCIAQTGSGLSSLRFTQLPSADCGQLYLGYTGPFTGAPVQANVDYYDGGSQVSSRLVFIPKAGFQGSVTLYYTATNSSGGTYAGSVVINTSPSSAATSFPDMAKYGWAAPAVSFLADCGVITGTGDGKFCPEQNIQRASFVTMVCRAFAFPETEGDSFPDVPAGSYYAKAAATAKVLGIATGNADGLFLPEQSLTRQDAMVMLYRAAQESGMELPEPTSDLSAFSDGSQVASYARDAVSVMTQLGVVEGNTAGQLTPTAPITRAEIAVILYRLITL
jgi:hypothetical protein